MGGSTCTRRGVVFILFFLKTVPSPHPPKLAFHFHEDEDSNKSIKLSLIWNRGSEFKLGARICIALEMQPFKVGGQT